MAVCEICGLIQLDEPMPIAMVRPRTDWIRYNEPHRHLDDLVAHVLPILGFPARHAIGIGPFEAPLLERLAAQGALTAMPPLPSPREDGLHPYLEAWQDSLSAGAFEREGEGADIVSCRYLLEHCHDPVRALQCLGDLVGKNGLLLVEVPDSAKFLAVGDYCFPWEEHVSYFVEDTLRSICGRAGFEVVSLRRYPGTLEDALIAVLRRDGAFPTALRTDSGFARYRDGFRATRDAVQRTLATGSGAIALFGIGHQAIMFANAFGIAEEIAVAVDDNPDKRGTFPPGFRVPVTGSAELLATERVGTCLLAVSPEVEPKIRSLLAPLAERGLQFHSIFAGVPGSIIPERPR